jgi:hypothetical protein
MKTKYEEQPDHIRYENDVDIIEVVPERWKLKITEKDSGEAFEDDFDTKEEVVQAMKNEIQKTNEEKQIYE